MNNIVNDNIYSTIRNSNNWVDFYNNINNNNISYLDYDNDSLESLDSDSDNENVIHNVNIISQNNDDITNHNNYYNNIIDNVIDRMHYDHIRRPINTNFNTNINYNNIFNQLSQIEFINNNLESNNRTNNLETVINNSFEESQNNRSNISEKKHTNKIKKLKEIKCTEDFDCMICMDKIKKETSVYKISCNHKFHKHCFSNWLKEKFECPICRESI